MFKRTLSVRAGAILLTMLGGVAIAVSLASQAAAGGYNLNSQVTCPSTVDAASWLNWWGQSPSASGHTDGTLYWWNPTNEVWVPMASGGDDDDGSSGNAQVDNHHGCIVGHWWEYGAHTSQERRPVTM
jgi:hypothetical protein